MAPWVTQLLLIIAVTANTGNSQGIQSSVHTDTQPAKVETVGSVGGAVAGGAVAGGASASASGSVGGFFNNLINSVKEGNFTAFGQLSYSGRQKEDAKAKGGLGDTVTERINDDQETHVYRGNEGMHFWKWWGGQFLPGYDISFTEIRIPILQVNYQGRPIIRRSGTPQVTDNGIRIPLQYALLNLQQFPALEVFFNGEEIVIDKNIHDIGALDIQIDGVKIPVSEIHFPDFGHIYDRTLFRQVVIEIVNDTGVYLTYLGKDVILDSHSARLLRLSNFYLTIDKGLLPGFYLPYFEQLDGFEVVYHGLHLPLNSKTLNLLNVKGTELYFQGIDVTQNTTIYDVLKLLGVTLTISGRPVPLDAASIKVLGNPNAQLTLNGDVVHIVSIDSPERFQFHLADFPKKYYPKPTHGIHFGYAPAKHELIEWITNVLHRHHKIVGPGGDDVGWLSKWSSLYKWLRNVVHHRHTIVDEHGVAEGSKSWAALFGKISAGVKEYLKHSGYTQQVIDRLFGEGKEKIYGGEHDYVSRPTVQRYFTRIAGGAHDYLPRPTGQAYVTTRIAGGKHDRPSGSTYFLNRIPGWEDDGPTDSAEFTTRHRGRFTTQSHHIHQKQAHAAYPRVDEKQYSHAGYLVSGRHYIGKRSPGNVWLGK